MLLLRRLIISMLLLAFLLAAAFPGVIYVVGIARVDGRPTPADPHSYSQEAINLAWTQCNEALPVAVEANNPWKVASKFLFGNPMRTTPGERAAWKIASNYNAAHRMGNNTWWHTSGVALTIWITRQWSAQEIGATLVKENLCG